MTLASRAILSHAPICSPADERAADCVRYTVRASPAASLRATVCEPSVALRLPTLLAPRMPVKNATSRATSEVSHEIFT